MYHGCCSVAKSCPTLWDPMDCSTPGYPVLHYLLAWICLNSCPLSQWCYLTISSSAAPLSFCLQYFPASRSFPMSQLFASSGQSIGGSASVLSMNIQGWFPLGLMGWPPCSPRNCQESSPTSPFKSISSSAFSLLYHLALTSIHDNWKNHSFDYTLGLTIMVINGILAYNRKRLIV